MSNKTFEKRKKIIYDFICDDMYVPMKFKEMAMVLQVNKEQRDELRQVLESLEEEGKICLSKRGKYCKGEAKRLQGTYRANQRGFGFVIIPEEDQDIFIGEDDAGGALDGDIVEVIITKASDRDGKRREGKIVKIVERGLTTVVGLYQKKGNKSYGFVIPDNQRILQDIFIPEGKSKEAVDGHKVVVELTSYGEKGRSPEGRIVEIIGHVNDPGTDIMSIVKGYDLPVEFPEKVLNQAERVSKPVSEADMQGRKDIRDWQMVTIDGEDAKDLDDAVSVVKDGENYILGVHIADVTNYVQENSALDREALKRGTSVYLADRVIPMLPHTLSNGICSLNAGEDRLALSCIMTVDPKGMVIDHEIAETVIHVDRRMSYTSVAKILEKGVNNGIGATVMAAAILGFSGVLQSCPGFQSIINFVMGLKMNPYLTEFFGLNILAGILGSGTSSIAMFFEHLSDGLLAKGASAGALHRLAPACATGMNTLPNAGGMVAQLRWMKLSLAESYWYVFMTSVLAPMIGSLAAVIVAMIIY